MATKKQAGRVAAKKRSFQQELVLNRLGAVPFSGQYAGGTQVVG